MTVATITTAAASGADGRDDGLATAVTADFLALVGWDDHERLLTFPAEHPVLGWRACAVTGCGTPTESTSQTLCHACNESWRRAGKPEVETFAVSGVRKRRRRGTQRCTVEDCQRPAALHRLCQAHDRQRRDFELPVSAFLRDHRVRPLPRTGSCTVLACPRDRGGGGPYCLAHAQRQYYAAREPEFDEARWRRTNPAIVETNVVSLLGLADSVVTEVLYGLQTRVEDGTRTRLWSTRRLVDAARAAEASSLRELTGTQLPTEVRQLRDYLIETLDRRACDPRAGWSGDQWSLHGLGHHGSLRFERITQPWLREATKLWVFDDLPTRRGPNVAKVVQGHIREMGRFSASLTRHRRDGGRDPRGLSRRDVVEFLNWLAHCVSTGTMSPRARQRCCGQVAAMLRRMRTMQLARTDGPLHGLGDDVVVEPADIPTAPDDDEPGRDLPAEVVAALVAALDRLDERPEVRVAVELLMDTGRRPGEIIALPLECLSRDHDQRPVLMWDNIKAGRYGRRLPISEATAAVITAQQDRVRARFPTTSVRELVLLPATRRNPDGLRSITYQYLDINHRGWVRGLPALSAPVAVEVDGHTVTRSLPFDQAGITLYSWRHTYAQRHADAGVPIDVLCELLDHLSVTTTQGYYRVTETRQRAAVDRVSRMDYDRHGKRVWRHTEQLLESERVRRRRGEVAVPYGACSEPSNVAAGGGDCPIRFRCVGCDHFSTDVSHLPDLEAYLADLRRNRERVLAAAADDWAKHEALPSDEEIRRVRHLVDRMRFDLDDLDTSERTEIEQAVTAVRRARHGAVGLGMPRVRPAVPALREEHAS